MNDDRFDDFLRREARAYHEPPPVPRDAMWARIAAERRRPRAAGRPWWPMVAGMAATLLLGIGMGWYWHRGASLPATGIASRTTAPVEGARSAPTPAVQAFDAAAADHMGRAEVLLTSFQAESQQGTVDPRIGAWAGDLLSTTRLLLDSPSARDPKTRRLLSDLEVVLAQIAQLKAQQAPSHDDLQLIDHAVNARDMLTRLRNATPSGPSATGS